VTIADNVESKSPEREAAEIEKLRLESKKLALEIEELSIQQGLRKAEARRAIAEAREAEAEASLRELSLKDKQRIEDLTRIQDHYVFHHFFDGSVNEKNVFNALNTMNAWHRLHPESEWEITINSPGGSVIDGMHLFDQITAYSLRGGGAHKITITVRGHAASMAGILLQAADVRRIGPESYLMVHEVSSWAQGKINEIKDEVRFLEKISDRVANLFVTRSNGKITREEFDRLWERKDWWLDSEEALARGFVDEIG